MVVATGLLQPGVLPILLFSTSGQLESEIAVGKRTVPNIFYYRVVPMTFAFDASHPPWVLERDTLMSQTGKCSDLIANLNIRVRRDGSGTVENVKLDPLPLEQRWEGMTFKADQPGIPRHAVSSCCDQDTCLDRCLQYAQGERWMLEIVAAQWAVDRVDEVYRVEGEAYTFETLTTRRDPGVWPVIRSPCLYCPLKSCVTNCSNGEYSTGYANVVVSPLFLGPPRPSL